MNRSAPWPYQWLLVAVIVTMLLIWVVGVRDTAKLAATAFQTAGSAISIIVLGVPAAAEGFTDGRDLMAAQDARKSKASD